MGTQRSNTQHLLEERYLGLSEVIADKLNLSTASSLSSVGLTQADMYRVTKHWVLNYKKLQAIQPDLLSSFIDELRQSEVKHILRTNQWTKSVRCIGGEQSISSQGIEALLGSKVEPEITKFCVYESKGFKYVIQINLLNYKEVNESVIKAKITNLTHEQPSDVSILLLTNSKAEVQGLFNTSTYEMDFSEPVVILSNSAENLPEWCDIMEQENDSLVLR
jgi:hypothetical protein